MSEFTKQTTAFEPLWQEETGHDRHSRVADPLFMDAGNDEYEFKEGSPAIEMGFVPFDFAKAGRLTQRTLTLGLPPVPPAFE